MLLKGTVYMMGESTLYGSPLWVSGHMQVSNSHTQDDTRLTVPTIKHVHHLHVASKSCLHVASKSCPYYSPHSPLYSFWPWLKEKHCSVPINTMDSRMRLGQCSGMEIGNEARQLSFLTQWLL